jgi:predicted ATPase/class 3 adenylate cyclase/DNA-binding CsgD family transcriptional regulator
MVDDVVRGPGWPLFLEMPVSGVEEQAFTLPTGTVTFLLSDVESSTRLWEQAPVEMAIAIPRHYALLDEAIVAHGGVRPVEQGEGDSVVGAFSRASDAVAAALDAQRAFAAESWPKGAELRVRIGLHTGEAQLLKGRYYLGNALNRCSRIRSTGHGGQVLVSAATAALVMGRLPAGATLEDLGLHRLKDLGSPERIWQFVHPALPSTFPALRSLNVFRHNLPVQLTPLVGRDGEIRDVCSLHGERLVTLTGSAGVGKTRLALAAAAELLDRYPGGVWWVELAPLTDPNAVGRAALAALGSPEVAGMSAAHQLAVALGDEACLLMLDNCEHLIAACAELTAKLLAANAATSVLATSREPLGVPGEITWRVPSLRCPTPDQRSDVPTLSQYDAVKLFVERARRARPSFFVSDTNASAVAEICHRLDGIPLAIELAAARCRQMSAERIAIELDDRFRLLTGGARTVLARQQTLAASLDWSHELLDEFERRAFRRLGVFAGPFPLEAAETVVAAIGDVDPAEVFDLVSRLVDKSLVVADECPGGEPRYRLLETLRAFAVDQARTAGELTNVRDAHATWWTDWLEPLGAMPTDERLAEIEEFHTNLKAALDWSVDHPPLGLRLLHGLGVAWAELGRAGDAMAAADALLTDENALHHGDEWLAAAWRTSALYFSSRGTAAELPFLERIESVASQRGDEFYRRLARWPKEPCVTDPAWRRLAGQRGDRYFDAWVPINLARRLAEDDPAAATLVMNEAEAAAAASGMRLLRELNSLAQAEMACSTGDLFTAIERARTLLHGQFFSWWNEAARILSFVALLAQDEEALRCAVDAGEHGLRISPGPSWFAEVGAHRLGLLHGRPSVVLDDRNFFAPTCATLWLVGRESIDAGSAQDAIDVARLWSRPEPHPRATVAAIEGAATGDEDRWHDALAVALDQGLRLIAVDALEGLAVAADRVESWAECLRLLGAAERLRDETGYRWRFGFEQRAVDSVRAAAVEALGADAEVAEAEGRGLDWRDAVTYARRARGERKRPQHGWASLTPTEHQVVELVAEGLTNAQIAEQLLMGRATVKTHLQHIFNKLGIRTRAALASEATRRNQP